MTFEEYQASIDCVVVSHLPEPDRLLAAYRAGSGGEDPAGPLDEARQHEYLWDRIERAYELGRSRR